MDSEFFFHLTEIMFPLLNRASTHLHHHSKFYLSNHLSINKIMKRED